jgi:hypothetical protein
MQDYEGMDALGCGAGAGFMILYLAIIVIAIASYWKIFAKAGKPGWAAIIPIYNLVVLLEIIGKPVWWIVLCLIPCVNIVMLIIIALELAKAFGKGPGFGVGIILLGIIFLPILAFGDAQYVGPGGQGPRYPQYPQYPPPAR